MNQPTTITFYGWQVFAGVGGLLAYVILGRLFLWVMNHDKPYEVRRDEGAAYGSAFVWPIFAALFLFLMLTAVPICWAEDRWEAWRRTK